MFYSSSVNVQEMYPKERPMFQSYDLCAKLSLTLSITHRELVIRCYEAPTSVSSSLIQIYNRVTQCGLHIELCQGLFVGKSQTAYKTLFSDYFFVFMKCSFAVKMLMTSFFNYQQRTKTDKNITCATIIVFNVTADALLKSGYLPSLPASQEIPVSPTHAA